MDEERRPTSLRLRLSTLEWLKIEALRRRMSVTEFVEQMIVREKEHAERVTTT